MSSALRIAATLAALLPVAAFAQAPARAPAPAATVAPADAKVYFISPKNGAVVTGPFVVQFGLKGMGVTQAGVATPNTGHHHILVDVDQPLVPDEPIPADRTHVHFGAGQTETQLDLPLGRHTLQLVLGDANHRLFNPVIMSEKITVTVVRPQRAVRRAPPPRRRSNYYRRY